MVICPICNQEVKDVQVHLDQTLRDDCPQHTAALNEFLGSVDEMLVNSADVIDIQRNIAAVRPNLEFLATNGFLFYRRNFLKSYPGASSWNKEQLVDAVFKGVAYRSCINKMLSVPFDFRYRDSAEEILKLTHLDQHPDAPTCQICGGSDGRMYSFNEASLLPSDIAFACPTCQTTMTGPRISVTRQFYFAAAHYLPNYDGKCANLHGHEWKVEISFERPMSTRTNMVVDYTIIKQMEAASIDMWFDHGKVNTILAVPTAENLLLFIWERLMLDFAAKGLSQICIWESPNSYATLTAKSMADYMKFSY